MNAAGSSELPLKPLPEESKCLALVADAERWLNKVKKILQVSESHLLDWDRCTQFCGVE